MSRNSWIIFIVICVGVFGGLLWWSGKDRVSVEGVDSSKIVASKEGSIGDHVYGNKDAKVVLVEYGDYQCPGCKEAFAPIKEAVERNKDDIAFVFRNFPLSSIHPNAKAAAAAAEAAGIQGKFWEMNNNLYQAQDEWKDVSATERTDVFVGYAEGLGLDGEQFRSDMLSEAVNTKIAFDRSLGQKDNVTSTPTFFLNGELVDAYVKDGKLVEESTEGANIIWSDAEAFNSLILKPAIRDAK